MDTDFEKMNASRTETVLLKSIAQKADHTAFETLYARLKRPALSLALNLTGDPTLAEDAVQEGMLRVWKYAHTFRVEDLPRAWIFRIVARECLRLMQKTRASTEGLRKIRETLHKMRNSEEPDADQYEKLSSIWDGLKSLPKGKRLLLALRFEADYTQTEIGMALNLSQRTVSHRLEKALNDLRKALRPFDVHYN